MQPPFEPPNLHPLTSQRFEQFERQLLKQQQLVGDKIKDGTNPSSVMTELSIFASENLDTGSHQSM